MKVFRSIAASVLLAATPLACQACKVYDGTLGSSANATEAKSGATKAVDGGSFDATVESSTEIAPLAKKKPAAADGGKPSSETRESSESEKRSGGSESGDDAGSDGTELPPDQPHGMPAADGGIVRDAAVCPKASVDCGKGWLRRITLDGAQVPETLLDFPVLLRIDDAHLHEHAADGGAVYFVADDGVTPLDFEVESYSTTTELVAWVRIPTLLASDDTTLFLGYGDGMTGRAKPTAVWSSEYHHVWHMGDDPSAGNDAIRDSTQRAHGTPQGSMGSDALVSGVAGSGLQFDGNNDQIAFVNDLRGSGPSTFSGWVKQKGSPGEYGTCMISLGGRDIDGSERFLLSHADDGKVKCGFLGDDDLTTAVLPLDQWKYLSWTWDGSASSVYVDAVRVLGPANHNRVNTAGSVGKLGNTSFRFEYFMYGVLDELHVATAARSGAWIATEYASQRPGSSFVKAIGEPQPVR